MRAARKIRLGVIGANANQGWASRAHLPAILGSPQFELVAVCTTRMESAQESARRYGAKLAFDSHLDLVACPEVDAVAVVVKTPSHYTPTKDALSAGKHVFTEWPLGASLAQTQELAVLAGAKGVQAVVGLQARVTPAYLFVKDLVAEGYVGEVMSCHVSLIRDGLWESTSDRTWMWDEGQGQTVLTTETGHSIDTLRFVLGDDVSRVSAMITNRVGHFPEKDTGRMLEITAPDNILISARLASGAVASAHVSRVMAVGSGYRMEIYGREGALIVSSAPSRHSTPQYGELRLQGTKYKDNLLQDLPIPRKYFYVPDTPRGEPYNIGQLYHRFAEAINAGGGFQPNFDTALDLYRLLETIRRSAEERRELEVPDAF